MPPPPPPPKSTASTTTTITTATKRPPAPSSHPGSGARPAPPTPSPSRPDDDSSRVFDEDALPSRRHHVSAAEERTKRRKTCHFIQVAGRKLKLPHVAIATTMLLFHHFYARHSFTEHDSFEVAVASLLLAAKTEEAPKKLTTIVQVCHHLKSKAVLDPKGADMARIKESALLLERILLHTIAFELSITHPYKPLNDKVFDMHANNALAYKDTTKNPKDIIPNLRRNAKNFADESLFTSLCLQHTPKNIALACVFMSAVSFQIQPNDGKGWLESLDEMDLEVLTSIATQIMESITEKKGNELDFFGSIRTELASIQEEQQRKRRRTS